MNTKIIEFEGEGIKAKIEVRTANVLAGMKRTRLQAETPETDDADALILRRFIYPALVAATPVGELSIAGEPQPWPPSFEAFCVLPEPFGIAWETAVFELNPHWLPQAGDVEKKV